MRAVWSALIPLLLLALAAILVLPAAACSAEIGAVRDAARSLEESSAAFSNDGANGGGSGGDASAGSQPTAAEIRAALETLDALPVAPRGSGIDYNRGDWRHWIDIDGDCQNTRAEVLIAESRAPAAFAPRDDNDQCRVVRGEWRGPWSGATFTDAGAVDIDHHVPLAHAHESGGWQWSADRKRAYANDLSHPASLQATEKSLNRQKGKQPPDEWRPARRAVWCRYAAEWIAVKEHWELTVTMGEVAALREMLDTCASDGS